MGIQLIPAVTAFATTCRDIEILAVIGNSGANPLAVKVEADGTLNAQAVSELVAVQGGGAGRTSHTAIVLECESAIT